MAPTHSVSQLNKEIKTTTAIETVTTPIRKENPLGLS